MSSKWFGLKSKAIEIRKGGVSIREIEKSLNIPRSTLSGWFKDISLTPKQRIKLKTSWLNSLTKARSQAVLWHNKQKELNLKVAEAKAEDVLSQIDINNKYILELALAMLYLGEGNKTQTTSLGNSNPLILNFFINSFIKIYNFNRQKFRCDLHLRADQDPVAMRSYWSKELNIPLENFKSISIDQRTSGTITYPTYRGVCVIQCGNIALQRRLMYLSEKFCEQITNQKRAVSSVGRASA